MEKLSNVFSMLTDTGADLQLDEIFIIIFVSLVVLALLLGYLVGRKVSAKGDKKQAKADKKLAKERAKADKEAAKLEKEAKKTDKKAKKEKKAASQPAPDTNCRSAPIKLLAVCCFPLSVRLFSFIASVFFVPAFCPIDEFFCNIPFSRKERVRILFVLQKDTITFLVVEEIGLNLFLVRLGFGIYI